MPPSASSESAAPPLLVDSLRLDYGARPVPVLDIPHLDIAPGALIGLTGPSGSGKSSLLHVLAGIEKPSAGRVVWGETDIAALPEVTRDAWRRRRVGLVFQDFHLVPTLDARSNILLPWSFDHWRAPAWAAAEAARLLATIGLDTGRRAARLLSRGEQQRVAIARALIRAPMVLMADEPTASLDAASGAAALSLLLMAARERGATLIIVSHDRETLERLETVIHLRAGRIDTVEGRRAA